MFDSIKKIGRESKTENAQIQTYFRECMDTINVSNLYMLRKVCMYISIVYLVMIAVALLFVPNFHITFAYGILTVLLVVFFFVNLYTRKNGHRIGTNATGILCCSFYFWLSISFIMMDAVSFPYAQALWMPMIIVVFPMVYIDRMYKYGCEELFVIVLYSIFAYTNKELNVFVIDMYAMLAAYVISMLSAHIILDMRSREAMAMIELKCISSLDKLTHVFNKGALLEKIDVFYKTKENVPCAMCIVDLDDFKQVNDNLGHNTGDLLLERVGQLLLDNFRACDIIGRYGGDEFVVFMPKMTDVSHLQMRCRSLQMILTDFNVGNGSPFSVSIGAIIDMGGHSSSEIFKLADDALYKSKLEGKNRVTVWTVDAEPITEKPILLVVTNGDNEGTSLLYKQESERFEILSAANDNDALQLISQYHSQLRVVMLEMDVEEISGGMILKYLKTREGFVDIPVIAIAGNEDSKKKAKDLGANEVLMYDTDERVYKETINKMMLSF